MVPLNFPMFSGKSAGDYHVIGAVRDLEKMNIVAELEGFDMDRFTPMSHGDDPFVAMLENRRTNPIGSMGLVKTYLHEWLIFMDNYFILGSYGNGLRNWVAHLSQLAFADAWWTNSFPKASFKHPVNHGSASVCWYPVDEDLQMQLTAIGE